MKLKDIGTITFTFFVIFGIIGGLVLADKEGKRVKEINRDYMEKAGLIITPGSIHDSWWDSEYLDVFTDEISQYVKIATELNIKIVYLRESELAFVSGDTIYSANLMLSDPSIDYTEKRS